MISATIPVSSFVKMAHLKNYTRRPHQKFFFLNFFKTGLVGAGLTEMSQPAEKLSLSLSGVLTATCLTWSRYSLVIIPKNWNFFVNLFVGSARISQPKAKTKFT
uniref:Mitochondrial pyruvate carrier n=1 Tax=Oncorhynchus tshawytscha TaxID=74940 RepID=A0A8C8JID1_ONCTS